MQEYQVTIGVQHYSKNVTLDEPEGTSSVKLIVWDLGGQETFKFIRPMFYKAARGIVVMFDLTKRASFESLVNWVREADTGIGQRVPIVIAANKADMEHYEVDPKEALEFTQSIGAAFVLTSAKDGLNVSDLFTVLASLMVKDIGSHLPERKLNVPHPMVR
jgi:small GTP-binding protein